MREENILETSTGFAVMLYQAVAVGASLDIFQELVDSGINGTYSGMPLFMT